VGEAKEEAPTPVDNTVVEILSDGSAVVETLTTPEETEEYYVQIQGSDRKYPAIVIRRRHRGKGATVQTISKFGQHSSLYADYEEAINAYVVGRDNRRKGATTRDAGENSPESFTERRIDKALRSALSRYDNSPEDTV